MGGVDRDGDSQQAFGARLKVLLRASGLSQTDAARVASGRSVVMGREPVKITNGQISAWVTARNRPADLALRQLVRVLIEAARRIDARLVAEGRPPRQLPDGLLDEQRWPDWLNAAKGGHGPPPAPTVRAAGPLALGVHRAVLPDSVRDGGRAVEQRPLLTPYLVRAHDLRLRALVAGAVGGGPSVLALLLGESTTGKTRSLYEAACECAGDQPLQHPADAKDLHQLLAADAVTPGTVLWLNETQRYFHGESGVDNAKRLTRLLSRVRGIVVLGAMWRSPYYTDLTAQGRVSGNEPIRDLLTGASTVCLNVPDALTAEQCEELRTLADGAATGCSDARVAAALEAGIPDDGRVIQYLSGGPELLAAYRDETLFSPVEHALITAALDARRLGHAQPISAELLAAAADGYLSARQRPSDPDWATTALADITRGYRGGDPHNRSDIFHTLTALTSHVSRSGSPQAYVPADYLDQQTRHCREDQLGPASLWDSLVAHASDPDDLNSLAGAAEKRGLFKVSAALHRKAFLSGHPRPANFVRVVSRHNLDPSQRAALWIAGQMELNSGSPVADVLVELQRAEAHEAVRELLSRRPEAAVDISEPGGVTNLLQVLRSIGDKEAVRALLDRKPADHARMDTFVVARLLVS
ncbi:hypothetical protein ACFVHB_39235 [Kitasatospora sp. NPDC127111]|uniref:hypothetical protein n=1 Tax=Kitasatospora sp. NPDC127111 TaxID=3345363 RepID=UPI0036420675